MIQKCTRRVLSFAVVVFSMIAFVPQLVSPASAALGDVTEFAIPPGSCPNSPFFGQCIPIGISHGPDGKIWVAANGGSVLKFNTTGSLAASYTTGITGTGLFHINPGPDGRMWFTEIDSGPGIGRITTSGAVTEISTPTPNSGPLDINPGPDGRMWFTENGAGNVGRVRTTVPFNPMERPIPVADSGPGDIVLGAGGFMWFTETNTDAVDFVGGVALCGASAICRYPVTAGSRPEGIVQGNDGAMWFTEHDTGKIGRITLGGTLTEYAIPSGVTSQPGSMIRGPVGDNNMYWTEEGASAIGRINPFTHVITEFTAGISPGAQTADLTVGSDGNIWFTEANFDQIGRFELH